MRLAERFQRHKATKLSRQAEVFGPPTELEFLMNRVKEQEAVLAETWSALKQTKAEQKKLGGQLLRFSNIYCRDDGKKLKFYTGLTEEYWDALWKDLQLSRKNILSERSAEREAAGRLRCPGAGRPAFLSLEDELLLTLIRLWLGKLEQELAYMFAVDASTVCRIFRK